jgi:hypothetical protein
MDTNEQIKRQTNKQTNEQTNIDKMKRLFCCSQSQRGRWSVLQENTQNNEKVENLLKANNDESSTLSKKKYCKGAERGCQQYLAPGNFNDAFFTFLSL